MCMKQEKLVMDDFKKTFGRKGKILRYFKKLLGKKYLFIIYFNINLYLLH